MEKIRKLCHANMNQKAGVATLISEKAGVATLISEKAERKNQGKLSEIEDCYVMIKG